MEDRQKGFSVFEVLALLLGVVLVIGVGWYVLAHKRSASPQKAATTTGTSQISAVKVITPGKITTVADFYDCVDMVGKYNPGTPPTCEYQAKTYTRPANFTAAEVRNLDKVSTSAQQYLLSLAKSNFDLCRNNPVTTSLASGVTIFSYIDDSFIYIGVSCDGGYRQVLVNQGGTWVATSHSQASFACDEVDKYKIPKALLQESDSPSSGECATADGKSRAIPY
jgi:hypothetical protein